MTPTLRTVRLLLGPYELRDERDFWLLFDDPRVTRWMGDGHGGPLHGDGFRQMLAPRAAGDDVETWAVRQSGRYLGHAEIRPCAEVGSRELVYALRPASWGQGMGREIVEAVTAYALEVREDDALHARVDARNAASLAVLAHAGFVHTRDVTEPNGRLRRVLSRESTHRHASVR